MGGRLGSLHGSAGVRTHTLWAILGCLVHLGRTAGVRPAGATGPRRVAADR